MLPIRIDSSWPPGARMGFLEARGLPALASHPVLEARRSQLELELRRRHAGQDRLALRELPAMRAYAAHYRPFGQTFHVLGQLESVALKGRPIPSRLCAVTALFMVELDHGLLAAGHDLDLLAGPLGMSASRGGEQYVALGGRPVSLPAGDLILRHGGGILSSVLQGPDQATPIGAATRNVLFTFYGPPGLPGGLLAAGLAGLAGLLGQFAPEAALEQCIFPAPEGPG